MKVQLIDPRPLRLRMTSPGRGARPRRRRGRAAHQPLPLRAGAAGRGLPGRERFYRRTAARGLGASARRPFKLAEHVPDMPRFRREAAADVLHYQWLTLPALDSHLLPSRHPRVMTAHYILPPTPEPPAGRLRPSRLRPHGRGRRPLRAQRRPPPRRGRPRPGVDPALSPMAPSTTSPACRRRNRCRRSWRAPRAR